MTPPACSTCGVTFDPGKRRTQESVDTAAVEAGWLLGWPRGRAYCPEHDPHPTPTPPRRVT